MVCLFSVRGGWGELAKGLSAKIYFKKYLTVEGGLHIYFCIGLIVY